MVLMLLPFSGLLQCSMKSFHFIFLYEIFVYTRSKQSSAEEKLLWRHRCQFGALFSSHFFQWTIFSLFCFEHIITTGWYTGAPKRGYNQQSRWSFWWQWNAQWFLYRESLPSCLSLTAYKERFSPNY